MSSPRITFSYSGNAEGSGARLLLEQEPVSSSALSLVDLANMLALVRSGISARTYIADSCSASLVNGLVVVPLTIYVWPSEEGMEYDLTATLPEWTTIGPAVAVEQERDFDLVIPEAVAADLPCLASGIELTWQTPAITPKGVVVDSPTLSLVAGGGGAFNGIKVDQAVFGVLRVRCTAIGYQHAVTLRIPKTGASSISDIKSILTANWDYGRGVTTLDLKLPACAESLLEACEETGRTPGIASEVTEEEEQIPELRYSTCTGQPIGIVRLVNP